MIVYMYMCVSENYYVCSVVREEMYEEKDRWKMILKVILVSRYRRPSYSSVVSCGVPKGGIPPPGNVICLLFFFFFLHAKLTENITFYKKKFPLPRLKSVIIFKYFKF